MTIKHAVFVAAAALACGCGGLQVDYDDEDVATVNGGAAAEAKTPAAEPDLRKTGGPQEAAVVAAATRAKLDYKISATDLLSVTVYEVEEMNRRVRVSGSGEVFLPLVGAVAVGGKTLSAAQALIEKKLLAYVIKPQVTLFIEEYGNRRFSVMGEVLRPGSYPIPTESRVTVLEAISTAGGFTPVAAADRARLVRSVNGQSWTYLIDVPTLTRGRQKEMNMILEPNDVIFIPQSLF